MSKRDIDLEIENIIYNSLKESIALDDPDCEKTSIIFYIPGWNVYIRIEPHEPQNEIVIRGKRAAEYLAYKDLKKKRRSSQRKLNFLFEQFEGKCFYCNKGVFKKDQSLLPLATIDHYVPLSKGGANNMGNLVLSCKPCNSEKADILPEEYIMMKFGEKIRQLREEIGISQRQLAIEARITATYVSKIERGEFPPPSEKIIKRMAKILKCDSDELLAYADKVDSKYIAEMLEEIKRKYDKNE